MNSKAFVVYSGKGLEVLGNEFGLIGTTASPTFPAMRIVKSVREMRRKSQGWQSAGMRVALVPTMGYLHEGHLSLIRQARRRIGSDGLVVVSIYVNPTQFGPKEDLSRYPRNFQRDCELCRRCKADIVFAPSDTEMYPGKLTGDYSTFVTEERLSRSMEGISRPTHFRGVTTVLAKLFNIVQPQIAVFGAKDWQQAAVVKRMVADLNFRARIIVAPTVREADGVAMSSRNEYLTPAQRGQASILHRAIIVARQTVKQAATPAKRLKSDIKKLVRTARLARLDYVEFFDAESLQPAKVVRQGTHMALAVFFQKTRLIDNGRL